MLYEVITSLKLTDATKTLTVQVAPVAQGLRLDVVGIKRPLAIFPRISFDTYQMVATVSDSVLTLDRITSYNVCYTKLLRFRPGGAAGTQGGAHDPRAACRH